MDIDLGLIWHHLWHLLLAFALALPIGWNREGHSHGAGLRTFPLVAVAACGYMLAGIEFLSGSPNAHSRVIYGIITGIGFIGGGAILKQDSTVSGTATAASIWNVGAIGLSVAIDRMEIAIVLSLLNVLTLWAGARLKARANRQRERSVKRP
jgi:putative Mg2+ transporter-C (MgtC) family protein